MAHRGDEDEAERRLLLRWRLYSTYGWYAWCWGSGVTDLARLPWSHVCYAGLQDWLLCWEMAAAALAHRKCFSYHDFTEHFNGTAAAAQRASPLDLVRLWISRALIK